MPARRPLRIRFAIAHHLLAIALGVRQPKAGKDDGEVLEREVLHSEMEGVPVGKSRRGDAVALHRAAFAEPHPMESGARRRLHRAQRGAGTPDDAVSADRPDGIRGSIWSIIAADSAASRKNIRKRA